MKTRGQIYSQEADGLLRDISMYRAMKEEQILRLNPKKEAKIKNLLGYLVKRFENGDSFADFLNVLDGMCTYSVKKNLYRDAIEELLYSQTRLQKALCTRIADLIDSNFDAMKLNYIIERLDRMDEQGLL